MNQNIATEWDGSRSPFLDLLSAAFRLYHETVSGDDPTHDSCVRSFAHLAGLAAAEELEK